MAGKCLPSAGLLSKVVDIHQIRTWVGTRHVMVGLPTVPCIKNNMMLAAQGSEQGQWSLLIAFLLMLLMMSFVVVNIIVSVSAATIATATAAAAIVVIRRPSVYKTPLRIAPCLSVCLSTCGCLNSRTKKALKSQ